MTILRVERLSKHFGGLSVLTDVSFAVEPGEKLALIGPNGAGKTTLINTIGGQLPVSGGQVFLEDRDITKLSPNRRLHLGVGRSFQINNLFFELSVLDNVLLALHGAETTSPADVPASREAGADLLEEAESKLDLVGLADKRHEPLQVQSYGDQRLVELLCAFSGKPKIVLLGRTQRRPAHRGSCGFRRRHPSLGRRYHRPLLRPRHGPGLQPRRPDHGALLRRDHDQGQSRGGKCRSQGAGDLSGE